MLILEVVDLMHVLLYFFMHDRVALYFIRACLNRRSTIGPLNAFGKACVAYLHTR